MRFNAIDVFRGIAAIMVVLHHMQFVPLLSTVTFVSQSYIFVDLFFVLSGFVITHSNYPKLTNFSSIKPFVVKRFNRLYPLHLFNLILLLLLEVSRYIIDTYITKLSYPVFSKERTFLSFIANLTFTQSLHLFDRLTWNTPSWSLSVEFYTYLIWACSLVVFRKKLWVIYCLSFSLLAWFIIYHQGNIIYSFDYGIVRGLYGFYIGMLTYQLNTRFQLKKRMATFMTVAEGIILTLTIAAISLFSLRESWLMPFLFALVLFVFSHEKGRISHLLASKRLSFLGKLSYSYYLNHMIALYFTDIFVFKVIKMPHTVAGDLFYIIFCLGCIHLMSIFTYRYIEFVLQPKQIRKSAAE